MITQNKRLFIILGIITLLLLIPLIAMQFTEEVNWSLLDFIVMGTLLLATGLGVEFILRKAGNPVLRFFLIAGLMLLFLLTWAELAVGIFGTPFAGS
ncbi:hypothetical protein [Robertkochia flava]|uniref:hypothetical protein n=1 Tax=Robertkochia flava TaxID=3447986 RepID=UPI001CC95FDD|nr:hypothetical protein [Robertkochia marina]